MGEGRVGLLVPNLFIRVPVEQVIRETGAETVRLADGAAARQARCDVLLADAEALGDADIVALARAGCAVVVFAPPGQEERLSRARREGAVALPRTLFLQRLPEILASALGSAGKGGGGAL